MKGSRSTTNQQSKQGISHKPRPEIRDDMDSRKGNEGMRKTNGRILTKRKINNLLQILL